jgi:hypothetical protein
MPTLLIPSALKMILKKDSIGQVLGFSPFLPGLF